MSTPAQRIGCRERPGRAGVMEDSYKEVVGSVIGNERGARTEGHKGK